jgi:hypothetical protein
MIARLIAWSARNLMLVLIATAFAVFGGIWALRNLPLDAIPDLSDTQLSSLRNSRQAPRRTGYLSADHGDVDRAEIKVVRGSRSSACRSST